MCSGDRSSSAKGAMAARAAPASSWSTSSSTVLSDWTIKGPSVMQPLSGLCRHDLRDAVDGDAAPPPGPRIEGPQLPTPYDDRGHHPLGGHPRRVEVADHQR